MRYMEHGSDDVSTVSIKNTQCSLCGYNKNVEYQLHKNITNGVIEYPDEYWKDISPEGTHILLKS